MGSNSRQGIERTNLETFHVLGDLLTSLIGAIVLFIFIESVRTLLL